MSLLLLYRPSTVTTNPITPGTITSLLRVPGPVGAPVRTGPITPGSIPSIEAVPGPMLYAPPLPSDWTTNDYNATPTPGGPIGRVLTVQGENGRLTLVTAPTVQPVINAIGSGSFTIQKNDPLIGNVDREKIVSFQVGGRTVLAGPIRQRVNHVVEAGEESAEAFDITAYHYLKEFEHAIVYPDLSNPDWLGPPVQETRIFDWSSQSGVPFVGPRAVATDPNYLQSNQYFPLPDQWPDSGSQWMWDRNVAAGAPSGFCYFRVAFNWTVQTRAQLWLDAFDEADLYLNGIPMLTTNNQTRGTAQRVDLTLGAHPHLLAIKAKNIAGRAGVLCCLKPVSDDGIYQPSILNSGPMFRVIGYPSAPTRMTPGKVMRLLLVETRKANRMVEGVSRWHISFNDVYDSAGRPWPLLDDISIPVGITYAAVLDQLAESLVDYAGRPGGRILDMWVKGHGTGMNHSTPWRSPETALLSDSVQETT